ncbi:MAG: carbamoyltransferase HypF [Candidatus Latescibacterota bacterium]|jgi:hydrogenase maturation protein HypF
MAEPGAEPRRLSVEVAGLVQGVGFRPFVYRLARELDLTGWVENSARGVSLEVEGSAEALVLFLRRLDQDKPPRASIHTLEPVFLAPAGYRGFEIRPSRHTGPAGALVVPDIATCSDCRRELFDPNDRRYRYPFINCTNCGPRFSIVERIPYDRPNTTMARFTLCPACRAEYEDPGDRRFHAQPNACPVCGPRLTLWDAQGQVLTEGDEALRAAARAVVEGALVAMKGLGGFLLLVDARSEATVARLRRAKEREEKPFALLYPSLALVEEDCLVAPEEARLLRGPEAPIVLLVRRPGARVAAAVAPGNPCLGVMLPYTPLHYLLAEALGFPVVATSGNRGDEPICIDEGEVVQRLSGIADLFLVHDRPIRRPVDDSVVRLVAGREMVLRRARGYAPLPVRLEEAIPTVLAMGAHLKGAVALSLGREVFLSQHLGDQETPEARAALVQAAADLPDLFSAVPEAVAGDAHPDYPSSRHGIGLAAAAGLPWVAVQHHYAHVLACLAENRVTGPALGVAWDGTGYGADGTVWGGEFLQVDGTGYRRVAHLRPFPLPGGERAIREPRRAALGLLYEALGEEAFALAELAPLRSFSGEELRVLGQMLRRGVNAPRTSSAGRLFDAVAALTGLRQQMRYEGQAAMELEFAASAEVAEPYPMMVTATTDAAAAVIDWGPLLRELLTDLAAGQVPGVIAARFHQGLAEVVVAIARRVGLLPVALTGGCWQNRCLLERTVARLQAEGFAPCWHQRVPPNDGGVALGQVLAAARVLAAR